MDILPTETVQVITISFKALFVVIGALVVLVNYFHSKEAVKMERKLSIALPGSVHLAMSAQLVLSLIFLFATTMTLFLF